MLIQGNINTDRWNLLIKKYKDLISSGINTDEILVILLNPYQKSLFLKELPQINHEKLKVYTLYGLCYNSFKDNEKYIKSILKCNENDILHQCGLEVSQYIFKQSIKEADFSDYISKVNLLHQLFRRYSLIVQNNLSNEEINERALILKESFHNDAQKAINDYKLKTIKYKSFDYLRQLAIFPLIYKNTDYFNNIKYLIVNDADEISYAIWQFIDYLMPNLKDSLILYDKDGSTRCGYLCAYKSGIKEFKNKYSPTEVILEDKSSFAELSGTFYKNIISGLKTDLSGLKHYRCSRRLDMIDKVLNEAQNLIKNGVKHNEIIIITPIIDEVLINTIKNYSTQIKFQILSGNEKLSDIRVIKNILIILKLINNIQLKDYEIKSILINFLNIPYKECIDIINNFKKSNSFTHISIENPARNDKYIKFQSTIDSLNARKYLLSEQIRIIYSNLIQEYISNEEKSKYEFLLKEAESFEAAFKDNVDNIAEEFIIQIENSVISENPINSFSRNNESIIVSSPQKIIDYTIRTKYQLWLDISNGEWFKEDKGTLYNAWVLNRDWNKKEYTLEDNILLTREKTARIVRKLMQCAKNEIYLYSSLYDNNGNENFGGLNDFILIKEETKKEFKIIPRDDQKPVLEYKTGKMGIMAVPGAGKTTILLALITKLINSGISPENIFVLTYMESAAKNFKERIKANISENVELPNISTIHGLALRIIKENGNYTKLGLDENFEICDDSTKEQIIKELFYKLKIDDDKYDNYLRSISIVKLTAEDLYTLHSKYKDIQEFYIFLNEYNRILKQNNLIDYDDMLRYAVELLNKNKEIANYYQNLCKYIIEDEAQDSSNIQQTLIKILSAKNKNVVRCGDINQSITSTFTNSNPDNFKHFIQENKKVEMTSSQRCAKQIYTLANNMIDNALKDEDKKEAFYPIKIKGTPNNPQTNNEPEYIICEKEEQEQEFILEKIKEIQKEKPDASIAILLRLNSQVNDYNEFFLSKGLKTSIRTDCIAQNNIYKYIYTILSIINNPVNNKLISGLAEIYANSYSNNDVEFIKNLKNPFIKLNPDELTSEFLIQLYWDIDYWLNKTYNTPEETALQIGLYYSQNAIDKSNTYLISTLIKKLKSDNDTDGEILKKLEYNAKKPLSAYKFFEDDQKSNINTINIMTMHKSKGDEFDYVFIPQLNEDNYPLEKNNVKLKSGGHFVQTIKNAVEKYEQNTNQQTNSIIKTPDELKKEQIKETLRLLYVGVTRAKQGLYLTTATRYLKRKNTTENGFFKNIIK